MPPDLSMVPPRPSYAYVTRKGEFNPGLHSELFSDWTKYPDRLKTEKKDKYLGYCCKTSLVKRRVKIILGDCKVVKVVSC